MEKKRVHRGKKERRGHREKLRGKVRRQRKKEKR